MKEQTMNSTWRTRTAIIAGATVILAGGATVAVASAATVTGTSATVATAASMDAATANGLAFTREEERMARDLYTAFADQYDGALPFSRIVNSEQRHYDAVGTLLTRYGIADPSAGKSAGSYADPTIQKLYDGWLAEGKKSLAAAYGVGVALEKRDIADLGTALSATSATDVKQLYTQLQNASKHHLAAFEAAVDGRTMEPGSGAGPGAGMGMGRGHGNGNGSSNGHGRMGLANGTGPVGDCPMLDSTDS
jgi:hypothetical protein